MAKPQKFFRARVLIFPQFQLKLLAVNLIVVTLITGVIWYEMSAAFTDLSDAAGLSGAESDFYRSYLAFQSRQLQTSLAVAVVSALVLSTLLTLVLSHRFSGPLVRLRGYFRQLTDQPRIAPRPRLAFRRNDFLSDLPPLVNQALDQMDAQRDDKSA